MSKTSMQRDFHKISVLGALLTYGSMLSAEQPPEPARLLCGLNPHLSELMAQAGRASLADNQAGSIAIYKTILTSHPDCYDVHAGLGASYALSGKQAESMRHLKRADILRRRFEKLYPLRRQPEKTKTTEPIAAQPPTQPKSKWWKWLFFWSILRKR